MLSERRLHLSWFRDRGNGQAAADAVGALQVMDGTWPVAIWLCANYNESNKRWEELLEKYGVNAITYHGTEPEKANV